jgi:hypothetical protein
MPEQEDIGVTALAVGPERASLRHQVGEEQRKLEVFSGKWINVGCTLARPDVPSMPITTSDVYEWVPGGFFVLHTAYGKIGDIDVGGVEILGYHREAGHYRSQLFDSGGTASASTLTEVDGAWTWLGERTRCTAKFSENNTIQSARHELLLDDQGWQPSMEVTLRKVSGPKSG